MAAYLEAYVAHFQLPRRGGVKVAGLTRNGDRRYQLSAGDRRFTAYASDNGLV